MSGESPQYVGLWHNPDLRLAVSEGPLTIAFRTLATEGMRPGLQGLTGLYGALVLLARFAGAAGKPFPSEIWPPRPISRRGVRRPLGISRGS